MRDFNLHNVRAVEWQGHRYPVVSVAGKASLWVSVCKECPVPPKATPGHRAGVVLVSAAGIVLHREQGHAPSL